MSTLGNLCNGSPFVARGSERSDANPGAFRLCRKIKGRVVAFNWAKPEHTREEVNRAGRSLLNDSQASWNNDDTEAFLEKFGRYYASLDVINNWRASHSYPMNTFQATLRLRAKKIDKEGLFGTRIKRLESIEKKLAKRPDMKMTQMQDIGGLRVILKDCKRVYELCEFYRTRKLAYELAKANAYIAQPKPDGYRSVHLIYKYRGGTRTQLYDDLKIEIQFRSVLQHAWATAVETVGIFTRQALKSSEGDEKWLRFFTLASSVIAEQEDMPIAPGVPSDSAARNAEIRALGEELNVRQLLKTYQGTLQQLQRHTVRDAKFFLLMLEPAEGKISAKGFLTRDSIEANQQYLDAEKRLERFPISLHRSQRL